MEGKELIMTYCSVKVPCFLNVMCGDNDGGCPFSRQVVLIWVNRVNRSWIPRVRKGQKVVPNTVKKNLNIKYLSGFV